MIRPVDFKIIGNTTFRAQQSQTDAEKKLEQASANLDELKALKLGDVCNAKTYEHPGRKIGHQFDFEDRTVQAVGDWFLQVSKKGDSTPIWVLNATHYSSHTIWEHASIAMRIKETCEHMHALYRASRKKSVSLPRFLLELLIERRAARR